MTIHTIIIGDAREMHEVGDESVHLVVTSPPYWQIKDYGAKNRIGFHDDYREYINNPNPGRKQRLACTWRSETAIRLYPASVTGS